MMLEEKTFHLTPRQLEAMHALGLSTAEDVLSFYPMRYDVMNAVPFDQWREKEKVTFEGTVARPVSSFRHGRLLTSHFEVRYEDQILKVTIFNRPWARSLAIGQRITITGTYDGKSHVTAQTYDTKPLKDHDAVTPVYSTKEGITQKMIRTCIQKVFDASINEIRDIVPEQFISSYQLLRHGTALRMMHFPQSMHEVEQARRTLKYEEFLRYFTAIQLMKNEEVDGSYKTPKVFDRKKIDDVISHLPFALSRDQKTVLDEIFHDMGSERVMYRLVMGDVGCGKTVVAALAMYGCVLSGQQAALLAPTEILARQHLSSVVSLLKDTGVKAAVLYSGLSAAEKEEIKQKTQAGEIDILVGTHSLLQEDVVFHDIGLVIADEQQRFGVEQRRTLREKGEGVDFLLMSATPIPRTLASTLYGDMDLSIIETMPPGRKIPITKYIPENSFRSVLQDVMHLLQSGHQLYVICAAVEKNEGYDARNVQDVTKNLTKLFKGYRVGMLHGQMKSDEKEQVMQAFAENRIQVLVTTTVVEVGVNVVNATGMIVYDADRFGLSQLHQLRGRIQRGDVQGQCWLLSGSHDETAAERLNVLVHSANGFVIAQEDLRLRGPGDILGTRQSGIPDFILGNPVTDDAIVRTARSDAQYIVSHQDEPDFAGILDEAGMRIEKAE
jgi:ATP-dependent DNA helicase RecG